MPDDGTRVRKPDTGDAPGEYQYWVEREHLSTVLPFPQGYHDLRLNPKTGHLTPTGEVLKVPNPVCIKFVPAE